MKYSIEHNVPLSSFTTFGIGGPAASFVRVSSVGELQEALEWAEENHTDIFILGGGSNVLIADEGTDALVIKNEIGEITYEEVDDSVHVTSGAGVLWDELVAKTVARGLWGLENLSAIPGSVGATPIQNVGAYGVEVGDLITKVNVFDRKSEEERTLTNNECHFSYRDSFFKTTGGRNLIVTSVTFRLSKDPKPKLMYKDLREYFNEQTPTQSGIRDAVIEVRARKFPDCSEVGTAGSFFKNPIVSRDIALALHKKYPALPQFKTVNGKVKLSLSWILDNVLHLKGERQGDAGTYGNHALVVVNHGSATAKDIDAFARTIEKKVFETLGIVIEREVTFMK